jgi:hypothetical protein
MMCEWRKAGWWGFDLRKLQPRKTEMRDDRSIVPSC